MARVLSSVWFLLVLGGCSQDGPASKADDSQASDDSVPGDTQPEGCLDWDNWTCSPSDHYCYATCDDGQSWWLKCYPGTDYPCAYGVGDETGSCEPPEAGASDECDACAEALRTCVGPAAG